MSSQKSAIVAIVGRANVGKSSLFNAVLGRRETIIADEPGTTRDSIMARATWGGKDFWLVDTAGLKIAEDDFELTIQQQIAEAAASADFIIVVTEADVPVTEEDRRVAKMALKSRKPVLLVINKIDKNRQAGLEEWQRLGIKLILATSVTQKIGIDEMLDELVERLPKAHIKEDKNRIRVGLLGRPNVGKSALFNALARKQQAIVADKAGTTRDVNRTTVRYERQDIELMDTAGIRRPGRIQRGVEHFSVLRSLAVIEESDVCLLLMDAGELNVQLDQKIAGMIKDAGKGLVLVVSKWDSIAPRSEHNLDEPAADPLFGRGSTANRSPDAPQDASGEDRKELTKAEKRRRAGSLSYAHNGELYKDAYTRDALAPQISRNFEFVPWAPLVFTSSVTGQNVTKLFDLASDIANVRTQKFKTSELNNWLQDIIRQHPPAGLKNRNPKLNYMVQEDDIDMPSFKVFGAHTKFLHWSYKRYMERKFRERWPLAGTPLKFWFIEKH